MKRLKIFAAVAGLLFAGVAIAANVAPAIPYVSSIAITDAVQVISGSVVTAGNKYATGLQLRNFILGNNSQFGATAPTLSSCGSGSPAVTGTNSAGTVTMGTSATGCVITFATAYAATPACVVTSQVAPATSTPAYSVSASAITWVQASQSGNKIDYVCIAQPGG